MRIDPPQGIGARCLLANGVGELAELDAEHDRHD